MSGKEDMHVDSQDHDRPGVGLPATNDPAMRRTVNREWQVAFKALKIDRRKAITRKFKGDEDDIDLDTSGITLELGIINVDDPHLEYPEQQYFRSWDKLDDVDS
ncbi:hypothetical protein SBRCBS47491_000132 [Sporothrix bragantina]|uniref:Uncharacterized protein n=1 Tax=Sporothrix bragantina TaxID=671064 RepID=A0ABP0AL61_9PEZI